MLSGEALASRHLSGSNHRDDSLYFYRRQRSTAAPTKRTKASLASLPAAPIADMQGNHYLARCAISMSYTMKCAGMRQYKFFGNL